MQVVKVVSPDGKIICTDLTTEVKSLLEKEGIPWFDVIKCSPKKVSANGFSKIEAIITPNVMSVK